MINQPFKLNIEKKLIVELAKPLCFLFATAAPSTIQPINVPL